MLQKNDDHHPLLQKRKFPIGPWAIKIGLLCFSLAALTYFKIQFFNKNSAEGRPTFTVPATRSPSK